MKEKSFQTTNPYTGEVLERYDYMTPKEIDSILDGAEKSYKSAQNKSTRQKAEHLQHLAKAFRNKSTELSRSMSLEMGKAIKDSEAEVEKCATGFEYYAKNLETFLKQEKVSSHYSETVIVKDSIGPILAIMPWNFPLWQTIRFAAPAVGIGNPIVLKHSNQTAGTADLMAQIFNSVEMGLLFNMRIDHDQAAEIIKDRRIKAVTLTGSARAGKEVGAVAGAHLKKSILELGGSDAYLVLADADIPKAAKVCAQSRLVNNGQSCIAAKRFIVQESILNDFLHEFHQQLKTYHYGDPLKPETKVGTLAAKKFQKQLLEQCQKLEKGGAKKVFDLAESRAYRFDSSDAFFPTRSYLVPKDLKMVFEDELFGPVAQILTCHYEEEAIDLANQSIYGLGGAIFSRDIEKARHLARKMESGIVAINDFVQSAPDLPFGGVKDSGYGRELGLYGFNEFCNIKTIGIS